MSTKYIVVLYYRSNTTEVKECADTKELSESLIHEIQSFALYLGDDNYDDFGNNKKFWEKIRNMKINELKNYVFELLKYSKSDLLEDIKIFETKEIDSTVKISE